MTPSEAALVIGCSTRHVRTMICQGKMQATTIHVAGMTIYNVEQAEAERVRDHPSTMGWRRGRKRKP